MWVNIIYRSALSALSATFQKQELTYRKQIARQLRTQYAEGIYDNPRDLEI